VMGKRSLFPRIPQDAYPTPAEAIAPLLRTSRQTRDSSSRVVATDIWSVISSALAMCSSALTTYPMTRG
jgi:hypothetical protein